MHDKNGLLPSLAVKKEYRNSGIGSGLVLHTIQVARERKIENLYLLTLTAKDFFLKFGFVPIARASVEREEISKSSEFESCSTSSTLMQLRITPKVQ
ncbi:MAG: GNAT family N-acetyltransferase [Nitrososphaerales archaeon]